MNSQEQRFLNAMYDHQGHDAFIVGEKVGFSAGQVNYYLNKWRQVGWYDTENELLTDKAPPRTETMRQQLEQRGVFNPLDRSRQPRVDDVPRGFADIQLPHVDQPTTPGIRWASVVTPDFAGFREFMDQRGHNDGYSWIVARNSTELLETLEQFGQHIKVALGPRWYYSDISEAWLAAKGIKAEVLT